MVWPKKKGKKKQRSSLSMDRGHAALRALPPDAPGKYVMLLAEVKEDGSLVVQIPIPSRRWYFVPIWGYPRNAPAPASISYICTLPLPDGSNGPGYIMRDPDNHETVMLQR